MDESGFQPWMDVTPDTWTVGPGWYRIAPLALRVSISEGYRRIAAVEQQNRITATSRLPLRIGNRTTDPSSNAASVRTEGPPYTSLGQRPRSTNCPHQCEGQRPDPSRLTLRPAWMNRAFSPGF